MPLPKKLTLVLLSFVSFLIPLPVYSQQPLPSRDATIAHALAPLARQIADNADQIGCRPGKCRILALNFTSPDKICTEFGIQVADGLTSDLLRDQSFAIVDRDDLRTLVRKERLSSDTQQSPSISRWLADKLHANAVLAGEIEKDPDGSIAIAARLFSASPNKNKTLSLKGTLQIDSSLVDLSSAEDLPPLPPLPNAIDGQAVYPIGAGIWPRCSYMPNPAFTNAAREAHISGIILAEAIIGSDGRVRNVRILKGLPAGLNENTLNTPPSWRCTPGQWESKSVPTKVVFEVNFRLY